MKNKTLSFLLALTLAVSLFLPGLQASAEEQPPAPPTLPIFFMQTKTAQTTVRPGEQLTIAVIGGPKSAEYAACKMGGFQFTLDYDKTQLQLDEIKLAKGLNPRNFEKNLATGQASYLSSGFGTDLAQEGTPLATAEFTVLAAASGTVTVGLTDAELTRPEDLVGRPVEHREDASVSVNTTPMLQLPETGSSADKQVTVTLDGNPAGTLFTAVYKNGGQLLRCAVTTDVPANAAEQTVKIDLSGGDSVKMFLLDGETFCPLCAGAEMKLN